MAEYRVTDAQLASIANAIRTKTDSDAQLQFPSGFVSTINNMEVASGLLFSKGEYFGTYEGSTADSLSCLINGARDLYAVLVIMHRDTLTMPNGWILVDNRVNPTATQTDGTPTQHQEISIYKKKMVASPETVVVTQASAVRMNGSYFLFNRDVEIEYKQTFELDPNTSTYKYTIPKQDHPMLFCMSNVYAGNVSASTTPLDAAIGKPNVNESAAKTVRFLSGIINYPIDTIINFTSAADNISLQINRLYLYSIT